MKFFYKWLKNLLRTNETDVEGSRVFEGIFVAKVLNYKKHPNADRLRVVDLDLGKDNVIAPVVCGASNFEISDMVILALPGAVIPHNQHDPEAKPLTLEKAIIRGVESQGMICSGKELGLSDDGNGILVLKNSRQFLGQKFNSNMD
jgi:phenylalanyl-tRNA synthetase beta chain